MPVGKNFYVLLQTESSIPLYGKIYLLQVISRLTVVIYIGILRLSQKYLLYGFWWLTAKVSFQVSYLGGKVMWTRMKIDYFLCIFGEAVNLTRYSGSNVIQSFKGCRVYWEK